MSDEPFVLDRVENPHPRMLARALAFRARSRRDPIDHNVKIWLGYLLCMIDATGKPEAEIQEWLDRHDPDAVPRDGQRPEGV